MIKLCKRTSSNSNSSSSIISIMVMRAIMIIITFKDQIRDSTTINHNTAIMATAITVITASVAEAQDVEEPVAKTSETVANNAEEMPITIINSIITTSINNKVGGLTEETLQNIKINMAIRIDTIERDKIEGTGDNNTIITREVITRIKNMISIRTHSRQEGTEGIEMEVKNQ